MKTQIHLPVAELKTILPGLNKVVPRAPSLPVLGCVRVERNETGQTTLQATNLEDYVKVRLTGGEGDAAALLVPFDALSKTIKATAREATLTLIQDKTGTKLRTYVGGNPIDQSLEAPEVQEWPSMPEPRAHATLLEEPFKDAFREALACVTEDPTRPILNGVYLDVSDPQVHYVVATNGRLLFAANSFHFELKESLLIPSRKFLGWHGFWEDGVSALAVVPGQEQDPGWVELQSDRWTFLTRQIEGEYPNWKQVMPKESPHTVIQLDSEASHALQEVVPRLPGAENGDAPITLTVEEEHLAVGGRNRQSDELITIPISTASVRGEPVAVRLNRQFLLQALRFGFAELDVISDTTPMLCRAERKELVIAPLAPEIQNNNHNEERNSMPKQEPSDIQEPAPESAVRSAMQQIEKIKETLRGVLRDLNDVLTVLKTSEKEHKATEKEIETVRATLRTIQSVRI
jgi:DNA polymerase III sliding clamp (beta) subunit (PCNA family)